MGAYSWIDPYLSQPRAAAQHAFKLSTFAWGSDQVSNDVASLVTAEPRRRPMAPAQASRLSDNPLERLTGLVYRSDISEALYQAGRRARQSSRASRLHLGEFPMNSASSRSQPGHADCRRLWAETKTRWYLDLWGE